jgi:putative glutamine amidotransferase
MAHMPVIGISTSIWSAQNESLGLPARTYDHGKHGYSHAIARTGALPFFIPTLVDLNLADALVEHLNGLLLSGGNDLDPHLYGQENRYAGSVIHPMRDVWELALFAAAHKHNIPVLGICRGHQLINVALGGTLFQDLSFRPNTQPHRSGIETDPLFHSVSIKVPSRLSMILNVSTLEVSSTHHQLLDTLAPALRATAHAEDGVIEAAEAVNERDWILSVQWHPELDPDSDTSRALFEAFVNATSDR